MRKVPYNNCLKCSEFYTFLLDIYTTISLIYRTNRCNSLGGSQCVKESKCTMGAKRRNTGKIVDDLTHLDLSRQRKYQIRKMRSGLCIECGEEAFGDTLFCARHNAKKGIKLAGRNGQRSRKWDHPDT